MKKIGDIGKIRRFVSIIVRNKRFFIHYNKIKSSVYLNVGCGPKIDSGFINLDINWRPGIDICWNIERGILPIEPESLKGIYAEHVLEHISLDSCKRILKNFYMILKKNGILRIIVPDAELYFKRYVKKLQDPSVVIPFEEHFLTPALRINALYKNHGHKVIYDYYTLELLLLESGFKKVSRLDFKKGDDSVLLIDSEERRPESLYLEAVKII
jgi:predicted SAM-dependent methyltransferase